MFTYDNTTEDDCHVFLFCRQRETSASQVRACMEDSAMMILARLGAPVLYSMVGKHVTLVSLYFHVYTVFYMYITMV